MGAALVLGQESSSAAHGQASGKKRRFADTNFAITKGGAYSSLDQATEPIRRFDLAKKTPASQLEWLVAAEGLSASEVETSALPATLVRTIRKSLFTEHPDKMAFFYQRLWPALRAHGWSYKSPSRQNKLDIWSYYPPASTGQNFDEAGVVAFLQKEYMTAALNLQNRGGCRSGSRPVETPSSPSTSADDSSDSGTPTKLRSLLTSTSSAAQTVWKWFQRCGSPFFFPLLRPSLLIPSLPPSCPMETTFCIRRIYIHTYLYTCVCACVCAYIYTCTCMCTYIYTSTHIYMYVCIYLPTEKLVLFVLLPSLSLFLDSFCLFLFSEQLDRRRR